jgi:anti-sigma-K factor RskA
VNSAHDLHALTGAYAVDALDDLERARFEQHLAACPDCRAEVDSLREATALLAETTATEPPAALRARVLAEIATVRPLPPETTPATSPAAFEPAGTAGGSHRRFRPALLAAAAAVAVLLGTGVYVVTDVVRDDSTNQQQLSAVERVLQADDAETYTQRFDDGSEAKLVRAPSLGKAVLVTEGMAEPPTGHVYELWFDHEGVGMVPAGLMAEGGEHAVLLEGDASDAIGAGITVEPTGGSDEPSDDVVTVFSFQKA